MNIVIVRGDNYQPTFYRLIITYHKDSFLFKGCDDHSNFSGVIPLLKKCFVEESERRHHSPQGVSVALATYWKKNMLACGLCQPKILDIFAYAS